MASERDANLVRQHYLELFERAGAHGIAVDQLGHAGRRTFGVVLYVTGKPKIDLPAELVLEHAGRRIRVPLEVRTSPRFRRE